MVKLLSLIGCASIVGLLAAVAFGTLFFVLEEKKPLLNAHGSNGPVIRRMVFCAWIVSSLLYIALTYWWS
jgi:hypothetical protein